MKRTPLRRKSKSDRRKLIDKADRMLQDWYRAVYLNAPCEICGNPFDVMHHFYEKSNSAFLRFDHRNLIFICKFCHDRLHGGERTIRGVIEEKRGKLWKQDLERDFWKNQGFQLSDNYLMDQIEKYALNPTR